MRLWLSIMLALLVPGSYFICELIFATDLDNWWYLRQSLYSIQVAMAFYILQLSEIRPKWAVFYFVCVGICAQNAADNIGKIYDYNWFDAVAILITGFLAVRKYKKLCSSSSSKK